jgi:hypothetical protein
MENCTKNEENSQNCLFVDLLQGDGVLYIVKLLFEITHLSFLGVTARLQLICPIEATARLLAIE